MLAELKRVRQKTIAWFVSFYFFFSCLIWMSSLFRFFVFLFTKYYTQLMMMMMLMMNFIWIHSKTKIDGIKYCMWVLLVLTSSVALCYFFFIPLFVELKCVLDLLIDEYQSFSTIIVSLSICLSCCRISLCVNTE